MGAQYYAFCAPDGRKVGALLRRRDADQTAMRFVYRSALTAPTVVVDHVLTYAESAQTWSAFAYRHCPGGVHRTGERDTRGTLTLHASPAPALTHGVPSYAEHDLLSEFLVSGDKSMAFKRFDESAPHTLQDAELKLQGQDTIILRDGTPVRATKVELIVNNHLMHTHWHCDQIVALSRWGGGTTCYTTNLAELLRGLHPDVVCAVHDFLATHHRADHEQAHTVGQLYSRRIRRNRPATLRHPQHVAAP